jgi:hypothetical protein
LSELNIERVLFPETFTATVVLTETRTDGNNRSYNLIPKGVLSLKVFSGTSNNCGLYWSPNQNILFLGIYNSHSSKSCCSTNYLMVKGILGLLSLCPMEVGHLRNKLLIALLAIDLRLHSIHGGTNNILAKYCFVCKCFGVRNKSWRVSNPFNVGFPH